MRLTTECSVCGGGTNRPYACTCAFSPPLTVGERNARRTSRLKASGGALTSVALSAEMLRHISRLKKHYHVTATKHVIELCLKDRYKKVTELFGD